MRSFGTGGGQAYSRWKGSRVGIEDPERPFGSGEELSVDSTVLLVSQRWSAVRV